jgi:serine/threonine-protein kinase
MADTGTTWKSEVLKTVEVNLERHIGPLSKALVRKAAQKTSNVDELTELLAQFIPSQQDKTAFLQRTQMIRSKEAAPVTAPPPAQLGDDVLRRAEKSLASYLGPMAKILVKKAARSTADLEEFCRILSEELPNEKQKRAFRRAIEKAKGR